jgi:photosystem II stability/assembly factor-like uncharacterized protein
MFNARLLRSRGGLLLLACVHGLAGAADVPGGSAVPSALSQPAVVTPKAQGAALLAVTRAGQRLVAVGERGTVLLSDDEGRRWRQASVPVRVSLTAVRFVDARQGWAVGHMGVILASTDGGETWSLRLDGVRAAQALEQAARASGDARAQRQAQQWLADGPDKPFFDIDIDARGRGYAVGAYNLAFVTRDGGQTWAPLSFQLPNPKALHLYGVQAVGTAVYIVGEQGLLLRSDDGGSPFQVLPSPYKGSLFGLLATRSGVLLAHGLRGRVVRSDDHGQSWQVLDTGYPASLTAAAEAADGTLVLLGQGGDLLISRDVGQHFVHQPPAAGPAPSAGLVQTAPGTWLLAGLRGLRTQTTP